ncbi:MAG: WD40 repeat domain-containing protein [Planctomycetes bacterium]|nr:WD40 repeat domain-containing protein [Planctomycetota bacterium]
MRVLPGKMKANQHLVFSPDGRLLVCGGNSRGVAIWDVTTSEPPKRVFDREEWGGHHPTTIHFDADTGRMFVAFVTGGVWTRSADGVEEDLEFDDGNPSQLNGFAISPDGTSLVMTCYKDKTVLVRHDLKGATVGGLVWEEAEGYLWEGPFVFRPGTNELFGRGGSAYSRGFATRNLADASLIAKYPYQSQVRESAIGWKLSPDGERVAFTTEKRVSVMDLTTRTDTQLPVETGSVGRAIAFHPGGQVLGVASGDGVKLLDAHTLTELRAFSWGNGRVRSLAFAPDGMTAATVGERGWVTLWDVDI